jgi:hypothetical protein
MLYEWFNQGKCGITAAATPGNSNHESGLAIDIDNYSQWITALESKGCIWYGNADKVHFTCPGQNQKGESVKAFQKLWNCNNNDDLLTVDGIAGTQTNLRIFRSPADGFSVSDC